MSTPSHPPPTAAMHDKNTSGGSSAKALPPLILLNTTFSGDVCDRLACLLRPSAGPCSLLRWEFYGATAEDNTHTLGDMFEVDFLFTTWKERELQRERKQRERERERERGTRLRKKRSLDEVSPKAAILVVCAPAWLFYLEKNRVRKIISGCALYGVCHRSHRAASHFLATSGWRSE